MLEACYRYLRRVPLEAYVWAAALAALALTDPRGAGLLSLCLFEALGVPFCPGCGLGHAVAFCLRGDLAASFAAHPLGPVAAVLLAGRVVSLLRPPVPDPSSEPFRPWPRF